MKELTAEQEAYLKDEISYLRNVLSESAKETRNHERFSLLSTGIIWSWYAVNIMKHPKQDDFTIILWIPAIITFLFGIRSWGVSKIMLKIQNYLLEIEKSYSLPDNLGWEQHIENDRSQFEISTVYIFWIFLQCATIIIPLYI